MTPSLRHGSESGQTTALVCAMLFTLTMFVALVVNVGQMVNRRVALQVIADTGAWTGATVQAVQLNHYAYWSRLIQNAYKNASAVSFGFKKSECVSGWAAAGMFYYANAGMLSAIAHFSGKAFSEAKKQSMFNVDDLFPGERAYFENSFSTTAGPEDGSVFAPADGNIFPFLLLKGDKLYTGDHAWRNETIKQLPIELGAKVSEKIPWAVSKAGSGFEYWPCVTFGYAGMIPLIGPPGYKLVTLGRPFIFVWRVKESRPTKALFFDSFLGPNAVPAMTAVAVAKAVGGDVHKGQSRYRAKMVPVSRYSLSGGFLQDPLARADRLLPGKTRQIVH